MNKMLFMTNLFVPALVVLAMMAVAGYFRAKQKDSIKNELFEYFVKVWNADDKGTKRGKDESFFQRFLRMFSQAYEYEKYKEQVNRFKYYIYKLLAFVVIFCIPFLMLFLITRDTWNVEGNEWNNMYLYTVILVPLIFAYLINKYTRISLHHQTWYRHMKNRHHLEWRMMEFIKDYELLKSGVKPEEEGTTIESLKVAFVNDICEYWKGTTTEIATGAAVKEENIFEDMVGLFNSKS